MARPSSDLAEALDEGELVPSNRAAVAGNASSELAKIGGITPPELTRSGRYEDWPPITRRPTTRLAYCTGNAALGAFHEHDEGHDGDHQRHEEDQAIGVNAPQPAVLAFSYRSPNGAGQTDDDADENDQRHAVADAAFANLFAQPHDEGRTSGQGEDGHQAEADAGDDRPATGRRCCACKVVAMVDD